MAHFSAAGGREGWMGPSPKVGDLLLEGDCQPCSRLGRDWHGSSFDWIWCAVSGHVVSSGRSKFASRGESHSVDPIRITEIFARGGFVDGVSSQANQFHHKRASRLSRIQHTQTEFTSQSFGSYSTRQPPSRVMGKGKERFLHLPGQQAWGLRWPPVARKWGFGSSLHLLS
jgi:hypothetical protein